VDRTLDEVRSVRGEGGCVLIDAGGQVTCSFNSPHMVRGWLVEGQPPRVGILSGEAIVVDTDGR
jgi:isoaspartyl peptidase/L-asparaginase-like protein (Ntn-hydrolase superfamily)